MLAYVKHSMGKPVTAPGFESDYHDDKVFEVTGDDLLKLFQAGYDVMVTHRQRHPGQAPLATVLLDECGRRFCQR
jgi:hypothetical protein